MANDTTTHQIEIETGVGEPAMIPLSMGEEVQPISVGKRGMWKLDAPNILDVHGFVYFDGEALFLQSADEKRAIVVDGQSVAKSWTEVHAPCRIEMGGAVLHFRSLVADDLDDQPTVGLAQAPVAAPPGGPGGGPRPSSLPSVRAPQPARPQGGAAAARSVESSRPASPTSGAVPAASRSAASGAVPAATASKPPAPTSGAVPTATSSAPAGPSTTSGAVPAATSSSSGRPTPGEAIPAAASSKPAAAKPERPFKPGEFSHGGQGDESTRVAPVETTHSRGGGLRPAAGAPAASYPGATPSSPPVPASLRSGGYPVTPSGGYPVTPSGGYPVSGGYPATASGGYPATASGGYPATASGGYPVVPAPSQRVITAPLDGPQVPAGPHGQPVPPYGYGPPSAPGPVGGHAAGAEGFGRPPGMHGAPTVGPNEVMPPLAAKPKREVPIKAIAVVLLAIGGGLFALEEDEQPPTRSARVEPTSASSSVVVVPSSAPSSSAAAPSDTSPTASTTPTPTPSASTSAALIAEIPAPTEAAPAGSGPAWPAGVPCPPPNWPAEVPLPCVPNTPASAGAPPSAPDRPPTVATSGREGERPHAHRVGPGGKTLERLAIEHVASGETAKAAEAYEELMRREPKNAVYAEAARILRAKLDAGR